MSLVTQINNLATAVGGKVKDLYNKVGTLTNLATTAKGDLVSAINEVNSKIGSTGNASINDAAVSTTSTYSSQKVTDLVAQTKSDILGGASSAYDTLLELQNAIQNDDSQISSITTALGYRLRFDSAQTLTSPQQLQACTNVGIGDPTTDFVTTFNNALV